ncbi:hypothetical protein CALK_0649 [Chitinivibrio alkaliphilus ACht1]|uniref:Secretion system C-terminal sorting domain-containing protein n=2 Tax=Chitinivibrio TaxID=1505231 RepID=U7DDB0_9BACT|nr:hypothetical protein CALK_0649 [Chitinivibrio alkaliphilus ACht1]
MEDVYALSFQGREKGSTTDISLYSLRLNYFAPYTTETISSSVESSSYGIRHAPGRILFPREISHGLFTLYTTQGRRVHEEQLFQGNTELRIDFLRRGTYIGVLETSDGRIVHTFSVK